MSKPKTKRLQRIRSLEEKQLDTTIVQLKRVNQEIAEQEAAAETLQQKLTGSLEQQTDSVSVANRQQQISWANAVATELAAIAEEVKTLQEQQQTYLDEVAQQRARLKGWTLLIDKMKREQRDIEARASFLEADERVLRNVSSPMGD